MAIDGSWRRAHQFLELFTHAAPECDGVVCMGECGKSVDAFAVEQYVEFYEFAFAVIVERENCSKSRRKAKSE